MFSITHHGEEKAEHQEHIVVSGEGYSHTQHELTEAGEPHDLHTTNAAAMTAETERNHRYVSILSPSLEHFNACISNTSIH